MVCGSKAEEGVVVDGNKEDVTRGMLKRKPEKRI